MMTSKPVTLDDVRMTPFFRKVIIASSGGSFLDGYVLAIIGVALAQLSPDLGIDSRGDGLIGVAAIVGLFVGTALGGYLTDLVGRRKTFIIDIIAIAVISVGTMFVTSLTQLVIMRLLIGFVIGADYPIATSMVAEYSPRKYRAMSMGVIAAVWYVGANVAYLVGHVLSGVDGGWRWMLGSSVVPSVIILIGRHGIPESPRWLARKGRLEEAQTVMTQIFGEGVRLAVDESPKTKYGDLFKRGYLGRVMFIGIVWLCQAVPMFGIYTFGPTLLEALGLHQSNMALISEIVIGTLFMIGCFPAMRWANSMGRRPLIIMSFAFMTVALTVVGFLPGVTVVAVICFGVYAFFSGGPGNLEWLYPNELFPTEVRASAVGVAMAISRIGTAIAVFGMPVFLETYGTGPTMLAGAAITALGLIVSIVAAPETRHLDLDQAASLER